jgi:ADP-ribose pyrophosphatase YjhB (NUDIX family)
MRHLKTAIHSDIETIEDKTQFTRLSTRAICLRGSDILMLYTERYHDYSLPGGGLDTGEDIEVGLVRELQEETGANNINVVRAFGIYEEYRPWYKPDFDIQHMISYCYICEVDKELGTTSFESHEINNGMKPEWVNIFDTIAHNEETILNSPKKGMSIVRETYLLKLIVAELVES